MRLYFGKSSPPERTQLDALRTAYDRGLRDIYVLPIKEPYVDWVPDRTLIISEKVHTDPALYAQALM